MRVIKSLEDAQIVLREILSWKDKLSTKDWDFRGLKIKNASAAVDPNDYVILSQLPTIPDAIKQSEQHYSLIFTHESVVYAGMDAPAAIIFAERVGWPLRVCANCEGVPSGENLQVNLTVDGKDLLSEPLVILIGQTGPVTSGKLVQPILKCGLNSKIKPKVVVSGNASLVTIELVIRRELQK